VPEVKKKIKQTKRPVAVLHVSVFTVKKTEQRRKTIKLIKVKKKVKLSP
jgi:hypothetical protein